MSRRRFAAAYGAVTITSVFLLCGCGTSADKPAQATVEKKTETVSETGPTPSASAEATSPAPTTAETAAATEGSIDAVGRIKVIDSKLDEARKALMASMKAGKPNFQIMTQATKEQNAELEKLAKEIEDRGADKQGLEEHQTLADIYVRIKQWDKAVRHAEKAIELKADAPVVHKNLIIAFAEKRNFDAAEAAWKKAQEVCTDKEPLAIVPTRLASAYERADRPIEAAEHYVTELGKRRSAKSPAETKTYLRSVDHVTKLFVEGKKPDRALQVIEKELGQVMPQEGGEASALYGGLQVKKIRLLHESGDQAAAEALLAERKKSVEETLAAEAGKVSALLEMGALLEAEAEIAAEDKQAAAREAWLSYLGSQFASHADSVDLATALNSAFVAETRLLADGDKLEEAEALQKRYHEIIKELPADALTRKTLTGGEQMMRGLIRRVVTLRRQKELIGKPMVELETDAWVNSSPPSAEDLKGKVILLDFWAVWCGPCRATFPHLTEWTEKHEKDGLVVIGLTRYHGYGWNDAESTHEKVTGISAEDEAAALVKFAKHHGLKHKLAFVPTESTLMEDYGVSGIPHVVVIDREGVIRMIRVGSGEKNAQEIAALLDELLQAKPEGNAAAGG